MNDEDEADTTTRWEQEWPNRWVLSGTRVWASEPHAKTGTSDITENNDDAKPVMKEEEEVDPLEKLKKDKKAMMRRIIYDGEKAATKAFTLDSGLKVVLPSKGGKRRKRTRGKLRARSRVKSRKKRRRKRRKSRRRKRTRKRRRKRRKKGGQLKNIALSDIRLNQRYTVTLVAGEAEPRVFRATLLRIFPSQGQQIIGERQFLFHRIESIEGQPIVGFDRNTQMAIFENRVESIQQFNIAPDDNPDLARLINEHVGGRRKKRTRRRGKSRR